MNNKGTCEIFKNRCRMCLSLVDSTKETVKVSSAIHESQQITHSQAFTQVFGYQIFDCEPQNICETCAKQLICALKLREKVLNTQKCLERILDKDKFQVSDILVEPLAIINDETKYKCTFCERVFEREHNYQKHLKRQHLERENECQFCLKCFESPDRLQIHLTSCIKRPRTLENRKATHVCPICGILSTRDHIRNHIKPLATANTQLICDICGATASKKSNMLVHMKVKHLKLESKCKHCSHTYKTPLALHKHVRVIHPETIDTFKCRTCGFQTQTEAEQKAHRLSHKRNETKKICVTCGAQVKNMKEHAATHAETRRHTCEFCGLLFKTSKTLAVHRKSHRLADYECWVCGKSYANNHLLRQHVGKVHPEYELPPPGTVGSKRARKKLEQREMRVVEIRQEFGLV